MLSLSTYLSRLPWRKPRGSFVLLPTILGFKPRQTAFYELAFRHSSCSLVDDSGYRVNNERLEFLGDSVLATAISGYLYRKHPHWDEGDMSQRRSAVVKRQINNVVARELGLERLLIVRGEVSQMSPDIMGNTLEALIGAIYLDRGYEMAERFVLTRFIPIFLEMEDSMTNATTNYKSLLLEWAQKHHLELEFRLISEPKRAHGHFNYAVFVDGHRIGSGIGMSKKEAHQNAAHDALEKLKRARDSRQKADTSRSASPAQ